MFETYIIDVTKNTPIKRKLYSSNISKYECRNFFRDCIKTIANRFEYRYIETKNIGDILISKNICNTLDAYNIKAYDYISPREIRDYSLIENKYIYYILMVWLKFLRETNDNDILLWIDIYQIFSKNLVNEMI